LLLLFD